MIFYNVAMLKKVKAHIRQGGIIAYPTEHCFGLGCDPFNYRAIDKLIRLKERDKKKGLIVIASKLSQLNHWVMTPPEELLTDYWPGPYTLLLPFIKDRLPKNLTGKYSKIAVRVTRHKQVIQLCNFLGMPLVSTSANYRGLRPAKTYRQCVRQFGKRIMPLPGTTNFAKRPSTIMDWNTRKIMR